MRVRFAVALITAACGGYLSLSVWRASQFFSSDSVTARAIAIAVVGVVGVSLWLIAREIMFGFQISRMTKQARELDLDSLERTVDGRVSRTVADSFFAELQRTCEEQPDDWQAWYDLAVGYDLAGDRKRARGALRHALSLFQAKSTNHRLDQQP